MSFDVQFILQTMTRWNVMLWVAGAAALVGQSLAKMPREDVVKAVLTDPKLTAAPPADGRPVFEKVCATCHKFGSLGKEVGPDLTTLASRVKKPEALESMLWPSRQIADQYQTTMIEKKDGNIEPRRPLFDPTR